jgi:thiosulfate/3-mercaptopyruvate sulfurtransferase
VFTTLISTDLLASRRQDPWVVVDCRTDLRDPSWGAAQYLEGHIPGAVFASLTADLSGAKTGANGRHPLPCVEDMELTFGRLGISNGVQVVVYDQDSGMFASRLWWMLRYLGHDAVAVLDGGWAAWTRERREQRSGQESRPAATFTGRRRKEMRLPLEQAIAGLGDPAVLFVDGRAPERYTGESEPIDPVAGHIPGAVNHFHKLNVTADGRMRPADELRRELTALLGGRAPQQAVMYCGSGVTACHNLLAMEHAGLPGAQLYAGSWSEWVSDERRPVETGPGAGTSVTLKPS